METSFEKQKKELDEVRKESFKQGYWKGQEDAKKDKWDALEESE